MSRKGTVTVKRTFIRDDPALIYLETEEPVSELLCPGDILENPGRTPTVEIRNCVFKNFPAIRLSSAQKMVFENNRVENCTALLVNDLIRYWSVSGCVNDLTIANNVFAHMGAGIRIFSERTEGADVRHKNIRILHNTFESCEVGIAASCVDGLVIDGNHFEKVNTPITVSDCTDVTLQQLENDETERG